MEQQNQADFKKKESETGNFINKKRENYTNGQTVHQQNVKSTKTKNLGLNRLHQQTKPNSKKLHKTHFAIFYPMVNNKGNSKIKFFEAHKEA